MRERYNNQLKQLHSEMVEMGGLCEKAISSGICALTEADTARIGDVFAADAEIDRREREIEALCMKLILQQQPVAADLREISAALKMISDMERIGDQASDIAEIIKHKKSRSGDRKTEADLKSMAEAAVTMVTDSIDSFVKKDIELAHSVIKFDDRVDEGFVKLRSELVGLIAKNSADGEYCVDLLMIAKYLERIGDHATNIAEWVVYSITGIHEKN